MTYYGAKELSESFRTVRKNTIQVAEDIPEEKYNFAAADGTRTIEKMLTHIALNSSFLYRFHAAGLKSLVGIDFPSLFQEIKAEEDKPRTKAEVVQLLKEEGAGWADYVAALSDEFLGESIEMPPNATPPAKSRFEMILSVKEHEMHHRAQLMMIERFIGIVPHLTRQMEERWAQMQAEAQARAAKTATV